jgi:hypothetical protein
MKSTKKIWITLLVVVAVIALSLLGGYLYLLHMPEKSMSKQVPDFSMSATRLAEEFEADPAAANGKFIDRVIEVTGVISEISTDQNNAIVFILHENEAPAGVLCTVSEKSASKAERYKVGDRVVLRGICTGMLFEVVLNRCVIVD